MPIDFPASPTVGQTYTFGSRTWEWTGSAWMAISSTTIVTDSFPQVFMLGGM